MPNNSGNTTIMERLRNYYWTPGAPRGQNVLRALRGIAQGPASIPGALGSALGGEAREFYNNYRARQEAGQMGPDPRFGSYTGPGSFPSMLSPNQPGSPGAAYNPWTDTSNLGGVPMYDPATGLYTTPPGYGVLPLTNQPQPGRQSQVGRDGNVIAQGEAAQSMAQGMNDAAFAAWGRMMTERMRPSLQ